MFRNRQAGSTFDIVLVILLLTIGGFWVFWKKGRAPKIEKKPVAVVAATATLSSLEQTSACKTMPPMSGLPVPFVFRRELNQKKINVTMAAPDQCIKLGTVDLLFSEQYGDSNQGYRTTTGTAQVTKIIALPSTPTKEELEKLGLGSTGVESARGFFQKNFSNLQGWSMIFFELSAPAYAKYIAATPEQLTFARALPAADIDKNLAAGAKLIDLRPSNLYAHNHHPQGIAIPYTVAPDKKVATTNEIILKDTFEISRLPTAKETPLIFFGTSEKDFSPLRAALWAKYAGWKNLYWVRGGEAERRQLGMETAESYKGIQTVSLDETKKLLLEKRGVIMDVRDQEVFLVRHISGAINNPYKSKPTSFPSSDMTIQRLRNDKDDFDTKLANSPDVPILIYAADPLDPRGAKAAVWLRDSGWKKIYWFRDGILTWNQANEAFSAQYPVEPATEGLTPKNPPLPH